ncbi:MAG: low specificity L-threonine aldolase [Saprospiraceae bacterium]
MINLLSDTATKPTPDMLTAMMQAEVGDDVFGEDPTVNALEAHTAAMFGHEAALFCPSGTMTNQLAIKLHTNALDEVICDHDSHIWHYESAGFAWHSGVRINPVPGSRGKLTADQVEDAIQPSYDWLARTRLVVLENTANRGGGAIYRLDEVDPILAICKANNLSLHLDGARLMNALVATGESPLDWGKRFDSISLCLSKGLGAPVGSVLTGTADFIREARRFRKVMGGGMRQAGFLAAAGLYALNHQVERLAEDHTRAQQLGSVLEKQPYVKSVRQIETNIVIFDVQDHLTAAEVLSAYRQNGLIASAFGKRTIRMVTYLGIGDAEIEETCKIIAKGV